MQLRGKVSARVGGVAADRQSAAISPGDAIVVEMGDDQV